MDAAPAQPADIQEQEQPQPEAPAADPPGEGTGPEGSPAESRDSSRMFEFSRYVHVGPGAEECEDGENGRCQNPAHFHAWIRLPNQFQTASLREKADAATARKLRLLRDEESDSRVILDTELSEFARQGDKEALIDQVVGADFIKDHLAAMREVMSREEYKTVEEDRERLRALEQKPDEERNEEEFEELQKHVASYVDAVNEERESIQKPLRDSLAEKTVEELVDLVREERIKVIAREAGEQAYSQWEWYIGTLKPKDPSKPGMPSERIYGSVDHLMAAAPEIIAALQDAFREIEAAAGRSLQESGNG